MADASLLALQLDDALDGSLRTYTWRRLVVLVALSTFWLVCTDLHVDIFAGRRPDMSKCECAIAGDEFDMDMYSSAEACDACEAAGGEPECALPFTMASDFHIYCRSDWMLGLASSCHIIGQGIGGMCGLYQRTVLLAVVSLRV